MNVVFLDFDGVVNIPWWSKVNGKYICRYNYPSDGAVNNTQAVQWISEFCEQFDYKIVISSTWRCERHGGLQKCIECLKAAGLRDGVDVIGSTPFLPWMQRGDEITKWLSQHPEVTGYLIFDDDGDMSIHIDRLVECETWIGFTKREYELAVSLHQAFNAT
jgi:hypothetical protein